MDEWLVYPAAGNLLAIFPTALLMGLVFPIELRLCLSGESPESDFARSSCLS